MITLIITIHQRLWWTNLFRLCNALPRCFRPVLDFGWNTPCIVLSVLVPGCWFVIHLSPSDYGCWISHDRHYEYIYPSDFVLDKKLALEKLSRPVSGSRGCTATDLLCLLRPNDSIIPRYLKMSTILPIWPSGSHYYCKGNLGRVLYQVHQLTVRYCRPTTGNQLSTCHF